MIRKLLVGVSLAAIATTALAGQTVFYRATSAVVTEPAPSLTFAEKTGLLVGQQAVSTPSIYEGPSLQATVSGGEIRVCTAADCSDAGTSRWSSTASFSRGRYVQARRTGPVAPGARVSAIVSMGGTTSEFAATSSTTSPSLAAFAGVSGPAGTSVLSQVSLFTGQMGGSISVTGGDYLLCKGTGTCGSFTTAQGTIDDGDTLQLRANTPATAGTSGSVVVTAGLASRTWTVSSDAAPTSFDFSNCGVSGYQGPTLAQCRTAYGTAWASDAAQYGMSTQGVQTFKVPSAGTYRIVAAGAADGASSRAAIPGGKGLIQAGDFVLAAGTQINIVVGQTGTIGDTVGSLNNGNASGGGGGTAVYLDGSTPLIVSGGGGGAGYLGGATLAQASGRDASTGTAGLPTIKGPAKAGANGNGGSNCAGCGASSGAGFLGNSAGYPNGDANNAFASVSYSLRGTALGSFIRQYRTVSVGDGGFGGGGSGAYGGGGGGGYSGGGVGEYSSGTAESNAAGNVTATGGGGGGSFNSGANAAAATYNAGSGYVTIKKL